MFHFLRYNQYSHSRAPCARGTRPRSTAKHVYAVGWSCGRGHLGIDLLPSKLYRFLADVSVSRAQHKRSTSLLHLLERVEKQQTEPEAFSADAIVDQSAQW